MEYKIMNRKTAYSKDLLWCLDIYQKCSVEEQLIKDQFEEMLGAEVIELNRAFEEAYESLLLAAVCKLGGHKGHYDTLHQTYSVYQYAYEEMELATFIIYIKDIIESDEVSGKETDTITVYQAASLTREGIMNMNEFMTTYLTRITGSEYRISFNRFTFILDMIENFLRRRS
ncbi:hypothetical protein [Bacillus tropicus]|uniref:hypothetical protein n=1 Tax=Bacillus tropicus TaxID=2026188 RepID=UPI002DB94515|nr:hypothetical protein [Bacillus tropicus]MEC2919695.1 hypothetical protein [Bacillus tropicus]MEC2927740.1 hypothetical protein [Bacillus tropicus]MEC2957996.1 hypothetical protein [Bacillus tropicus]MEC3051639.1 hypothetical protein [Bacillus tropicus]MEC3077456.1 hypothetical protein [Bacillus tropicus]